MAKTLIVFECEFCGRVDKPGILFQGIVRRPIRGKEPIVLVRAEKEEVFICRDCLSEKFNMVDPGRYV